MTSVWRGLQRAACCSFSEQRFHCRSSSARKQRRAALNSQSRLQKFPLAMKNLTKEFLPQAMTLTPYRDVYYSFTSGVN